MTKSNQSVHGVWIATVNNCHSDVQNLTGCDLNLWSSNCQCDALPTELQSLMLESGSLIIVSSKLYTIK